MKRWATTRGRLSLPCPKGAPHKIRAPNGRPHQRRTDQSSRSHGCCPERSRRSCRELETTGCRSGPAQQSPEVPAPFSGRRGGPSPQNTAMRYTDELARLEESLDHIRGAPTDAGTVELIARRPAEDEREVLTEARLGLRDGLEGDTWHARGSRHTPDGGPDAEAQ